MGDILKIEHCRYRFLPERRDTHPVTMKTFSAWLGRFFSVKLGVSVPHLVLIELTRPAELGVQNTNYQ
jgi:hypothetical protein